MHSTLEYQKLFWVVSNLYLYHTYHVREKTPVELITYFLPKIWEFLSNTHPPLSTCEYAPVYASWLARHLSQQKLRFSCFVRYVEMDVCVIVFSPAFLRPEIWQGSTQG